MEYIKTLWEDKVVQYPNRYKDQNNNILELTPDFGETLQEGTLVNAEKMNNIENGIFGICEELNKPRLTVITEKNTNCDDYTEDGDYSFELEYTPVGAPFGAVNGKLKVRHITPDTIKQTWYRKGTKDVNDQEIGFRTKIGNSWSNWQRNLTSKEVVDSLTSDRTDLPLSAKQGKALNKKIEYEKITSGSYNDLTNNDPYHPKRYRIEGTLSDGPSTNWGWLDVYCTVGSGGNYTYIHIFVADTGKMWSRRCSSSWGDWVSIGTVTGININGASKGTSGVVDLGTVVTGIKMNNENKTISNGVVNLGIVVTNVSDKENIINKVPTLTPSNTNEQYPSAKAVFDALYFKPGETWTVSQGCCMTGHVTSGASKLYFMLSTSKSMAKISSIKCNSMSCELRGVNGYIISSGYIPVATEAGVIPYRCECVKQTDHCIRIMVTTEDGSAFPNATNNTPIAAFSANNMKFTFN